MIFLQLLILSLAKATLLQNTECPIYSCEKLAQNKCSVIVDSKYQLKECPHNHNCNFKKEEKSYCDLSKYEYNERAYIGGKCKNNLDCLSNNCKDKKCIGSVDRSCKSNDDCEFGLHCKINQCIAPPKEGECRLDEDCAWPLGCFNNECTPFFSIENKAKGDDTKPYFCKSGRSYNNICNSIKDSIQTSCNDIWPCIYEDMTDEFITVKDACVCTISTEPKQICKPGDANNPYWKTALDLLIQSISDDFADTCNAKEKRPGFCRESLRNNWNIRNANIELIKSLILAENAYQIDNSVPCSLKSVLKFDDTPPQPENDIFQCPKYNCRVDELFFDDNTCAYSNNPFNQQGDNITVELQEICSRGYKCDYQSSQVYHNWTTNSTCKEIPTQKSWRYKYPGEDCTSHLQCLPGTNQENHYCIDGICSGDNNNCSSHRDCNKGYFCNGINCQKQKKENQQCLDEFECFNYLGCLNNTCVPYYSLPNGTYLNKTHPDPNLCQMGLINEETNQCAETDYYNIDKDRKDDNGFVQCTVGQLCNYTTGYYIKKQLIVLTKVCECGFRENEMAYCPIPQTVNQHEWKSYFKLKNSQYDNNCHTLRRSECIEEFPDSHRDDLYYYIRQTINAHLFYNSSNCIISILSSLKIIPNYIILILGIVILIMKD